VVAGLFLVYGHVEVSCKVTEMLRDSRPSILLTIARETLK